MDLIEQDQENWHKFSHYNVGLYLHRFCTSHSYTADIQMRKLEHHIVPGPSVGQLKLRVKTVKIISLPGPVLFLDVVGPDGTLDSH